MFLALLVAMVGCAKAGRVAMTLEPDRQAVIVVEGRHPHVRIDTLGGADAARLEIRRLEDRSDPVVRTIGTYEATLDGPTRFTVRNITDGRVLVEIKTTGHAGLVVEQSPGGSQ